MFTAPTSWFQGFYGYGSAGAADWSHHAPIYTPASSIPTGQPGSSPNNPYRLPSDVSSVNFAEGDRPQYVAYQGSTYQYQRSTDDNLFYQNICNSRETLKLSYTGESTPNDDIVGYDSVREQIGTEKCQVGTEKVLTGYEQVQTGTEKVQTGTEQVQVGTEQYITGYKQVQTGTEQYQTGTEQYITGYEQVQTGTEQYQTGTEQYQTGTEKVLTGYDTVQVGTEKVQTGTEKVQTGTEKYISGYKQVQTGTEKVQTGTEKYISGYKQVQTGTEKVQTGTEKYISGYKQVQTGTEKVQTGTEKYISGYKQVQTGTEKVQTGTEKVQVGTEIVGYNTRVETGTIAVNRELDGKANGGAVGDILDQGTGLLLDANKANSVFASGSGQYQVNGLTGEANNTNGENVDIFKKTNADDMYVAGDPQVGGKGNNYAPDTITPGTGYLTMYEDGTDNGRKVTINSHVDQVNAQGNKAFTEYGWVIQDDNGQKTTATLSGGQLKVNGQVVPIGTEKVIGDPANPVAKFYWADMSGGENGATEKRLVFESYEQVTPETRQKLIDAGANASQVDGLKSTFKASFGFRVPDGYGSYRSSAGVDGGMSTTSNGVKTYYDAHFYEPDSFQLPTKKVYQDPVYGPKYEERPVYTDKPVYEQQPVYSERPVYTDKPVYEQQPVYSERPVYTDKPVYEKQPVYSERPVYTDKPVYEQQPVYSERPVYTDKPVYGERPVYDQVAHYKDQPVYGTRPIYEQQPVYGERPIYGERPVYDQVAHYEDQPVYGNRPVYGERPVYEDQPVYGTRPIYGERPVYENQPVYGERPLYEDRPVYDETPIYENKPIYDEQPVYKEKPIFKCVKKPIYGTDYDVAVDVQKSACPPKPIVPPYDYGSNKGIGYDYQNVFANFIGVCMGNSYGGAWGASQSSWMLGALMSLFRS